MYVFIYMRDTWILQIQFLVEIVSILYVAFQSLCFIYVSKNVDQKHTSFIK